MDLCSDADALAACQIQELERSLLSWVSKHHDGQAEQLALRLEESQLFDICKGLEGQMAVFVAENYASQVKLEDLTSQCGDVLRGVNK